MPPRRLPRPSELRPYLRTGPIHLWPIERRLAATETSLQRSRDAFKRVEFVPRVLRDVSSVDLSTTILGRPSAMPLVFAPTGFTRLMNHEGEPAVARVAARLGIPYALSTLGTTSPEELAAF